MNKRSLAVLLMLNVMLLVSLAVVSLTPQPAAAQIGRRGDYAMIAGEVRGGNNQAGVYVLDLNTQMIATVMFDARTKKIRPIARRRISDDLSARTAR